MPFGGIQVLILAAADHKEISQQTHEPGSKPLTPEYSGNFQTDIPANSLTPEVIQISSWYNPMFQNHAAAEISFSTVGMS